MLTGDSQSPMERMTRPRRSTSRLTWHPTGQCVQVVLTVVTALSHLWSRSTSAPTGHTSMHAPQNSQPDSSSDIPCDVPTSTVPDRSIIAMASSPRISSQTRTQRAQTMQRL